MLYTGAASKGSYAKASLKRYGHLPQQSIQQEIGISKCCLGFKTCTKHERPTSLLPGNFPTTPPQDLEMLMTNHAFLFSAGSLPCLHPCKCTTCRPLIGAKTKRPSVIAWLSFAEAIGQPIMTSTSLSARTKSSFCTVVLRNMLHMPQSALEL